MFKAVANLSSRSMATVAVVLVCASIAMGMCFSGGFVFTIALLIYGALPASAFLMWMERKDLKKLFWLPIVLSLFYLYCRLALSLVPADYRLEPILDTIACFLPLVGLWFMPVTKSRLRILVLLFKGILISIASLIFLFQILIDVVDPVWYEDFSEQIGYRLALKSETFGPSRHFTLYRDDQFLPGILRRSYFMRARIMLRAERAPTPGKYRILSETMFVDELTGKTHMFE